MPCDLIGMQNAINTARAIRDGTSGQASDGGDLRTRIGAAYSYLESQGFQYARVAGAILARYLGLWIGMSTSLLLLSGCTSWFWNTSDPFLAEIVDARMNSTKADIDITDIVEKYIAIGTTRAEAETFLKRRGFKTYFYENQYTLVESGKAVLGVKAGPKSFFPCETETKVILYLSEDLVVLRLEGHIFTSCL